MSRTVSARIPKEMHENLRDKCNDLGCSINDYVVGCIELMLDGHTEFDFGNDEEEDERPEVITNEKSKEIPTAKVTKISYDGGKTWIESPKKEEKPKVIIHLDD